MVATVEPRVEIDDGIRQNPELLKAVTDGTEFLLRSRGDADHAAVLRWRLAPADAQTVELVLSDTPDLSDVVARRSFPTTEMMDRYSRESGMLRAWNGLLRARADKHKARVDQLISELNRVLGDQNHGEG